MSGELPELVEGTVPPELPRGSGDAALASPVIKSENVPDADATLSTENGEFLPSI